MKEKIKLKILLSEETQGSSVGGFAEPSLVFCGGLQHWDSVCGDVPCWWHVVWTSSEWKRSLNNQNILWGSANCFHPTDKHLYTPSGSTPPLTFLHSLAPYIKSLWKAFGLSARLSWHTYRHIRFLVKELLLTSEAQWCPNWNKAIEHLWLTPSGLKALLEESNGGCCTVSPSLPYAGQIMGSLKRRTDTWHFPKLLCFRS